MKRLQAAELAVILYELMAKRKSLQDIVDTARSGIGNPIFIGDSNMNIIAHSVEKEPINDTQWNNILSSTNNYIEFLKLRGHGVEDLVMKKQNEVIILDNPYLDHRWIYSSVCINGIFVAQVCVVEYFQKFSRYDKKIVACLNTVTLFMINRNSSLSSLRYIKMEYLLTRIITGEKAPTDQLKEQMVYLKWNNPVLYFIAIIAPSDAVNAYNLVPHKHWLINSIRDSCGIVLENQIVLLISRDRPIGKTLDLFSKSVEKYLSDARGTMCVSRCFSDLNDIVDSYEQTKNTLELSRLLPSKQKICCFEEYYMSNILRGVLKNAIGYDYMHSQLLEIMQYDKTYGTNYLNDLYVYLATGCSSRKSAAMLGIHRNTVNYRIDKICSLFAIDLKDAEMVFDLNLSLKTLHFHQQLEQSDKANKP
jgi:hypothetical protein